MVYVKMCNKLTVNPYEIAGLPADYYTKDVYLSLLISKKKLNIVDVPLNVSEFIFQLTCKINVFL